MPCYDYESNQDKNNCLADKARLESLLCSACGTLEQSYGYNFALNPLLHEWWYEHKETDVQRTEQKIISAINKERKTPLTNEQIKLMKLYGIFNE